MKGVRLQNIVISEAISADLTRLRQIYLTVRIETFPWLEPDKMKLSDFDESTEGELVLKAETDENIVGFVSIWKPEKFIHNLYVEPAYQGKGVGTKLIDEVAKKVGFPLSLKCLKENTHALNYYRAHGWYTVQEDFSSEGYYFLMRNDGPNFNIRG